MTNGIFLQGSKRAIILQHAYTGTPNDVRLLGTALHKLGYTVYMPLLSGHGTKDMRAILNKNPKMWREDTKKAVQFVLDKGCAQIAIFGLSLGGMLALDMLTQSHPFIIGGGSFNSPVPLDDSSKVEEQFMVYANQFYDETVISDKEEYLSDLVEKIPVQLEQIKILSEEIAQYLNRIDVPVYIAQSGADELIDARISEHMVRQISFAPVEFVWFEKAKHVITIGESRVAFQNSVIDFIEKLDWEVI
ncbi:carboxylesterase [Granulicatella sp. zg-ZJ]|uniref:alpha/beta hydrolase n=1 Tax=unclassified Granulicatella TaxID=2630493 RepID=UPI0013BFC56C|nr:MULTISPECIES: alpha/beta hydrolase [unclassified Granulicatella]MBS4750682.1 alpha/beta hydrolase [Carnobacteriaceae bacterium zg-ZUI78]NEW63432.1 carboxylesterase [Granulicatella sp. zg-ZJ]NEW66457.1 carboxylesterase [Granulicatella sp. zg-84]QMI86340.1 alpha/beta hydrolase [Carnobacteriaceae bacterium zg-84]